MQDILNEFQLALPASMHALSSVCNTLNVQLGRSNWPFFSKLNTAFLSTPCNLGIYSVTRDLNQSSSVIVILQAVCIDALQRTSRKCQCAFVLDNADVDHHSCHYSGPSVYLSFLMWLIFFLAVFLLALELGVGLGLLCGRRQWLG